jgi:hypothetical protein
VHPRVLGEGVDAFVIKLASSAFAPMRKATEERDYVISIWVDCPGYVIPEDFKKMCLPELLEDAVRQLEHNHGISLLVSSIPRLFGISSDGPTLWRLLEHMERRPVTYGTREVYEMVICLILTPVTTSGKIPLRIQTPKSPSISQETRDYLQEFRGVHDTREVFRALGPVLHNVSRSALLRLNSDLSGHLMKLYGHDDPTGIDYWFNMSRLSLREINLHEFVAEPVTLSPTDDHHEAVYRLVVIMLDLDKERCKASGLRVMVSLTKHAHIGFTNLDSRKRDRLCGDGTSRSVVTICAPRDKAEKENLLLEAVKESAHYSRNTMSLASGSLTSGCHRCTLTGLLTGTAKMLF